jgi:hypothetical protein
VEREQGAVVKRERSPALSRCHPSSIVFADVLRGRPNGGYRSQEVIKADGYLEMSVEDLAATAIGWGA